MLFSVAGVILSSLIVTVDRIRDRVLHVHHSKAAASEIALTNDKRREYTACLVDTKTTFAYVAFPRGVITIGPSVRQICSKHSKDGATCAAHAAYSSDASKPI